MLSESGNIRTSSDVTMSVMELYDLVYVRKLSDKQIAKIKGLAPKTIRNWRRKCQFDSTFKTGVMDLPVSEVKQHLTDGKKDEEIIKMYNTTMTSFLAFKRRYGLASDSFWPIDRKQMLEYVLQDLTDKEISERCGQPETEVTVLREKYELKPNNGIKLWQTYGNNERTKDDDFDRPDLITFAHQILGTRLRISFSGGYVLDGKPVLMEDLIEIVHFK